ncbi:hypothetical protein IX317_001328 [Fusobacterium sp. DD29]|uniref:HdeD family acid-resistance protein n=1 Tax=unclassified Fusobacterium TaxID=2648384 RepID=UPI001B8CE398|nr:MULTISPECIES: DUF308 domain-containing protein [unclassified Fusobacterium]MBR8701430.1 hypothetical protein [Fusobacterium sp. DD45]MBR8711184.1 hypothetical protein [Fusobacterium sp. DD28]MBR8749653.1 hypothetical protein [Fusobacterium sp. DD29]MBR8751758.1 hypothetical protein [Fusobacterium sp. DD26]MBR8761914.1 hypothetical protein [Fusobacterium sp. DD25]
MSVKTYRWISLLSGVLLVIFSFMMLGNPASGLIAVSIFLGIAFVVHGFGELSMYFTLPHDVKSAWLLVGGLISAIFGLWILTAQGTVSLSIALPFILASWIMFFGILRIVASMSLRAFSIHLSNVNIVLGILGIVLGVVMLNHPAIGSSIITIVIFLIFFCQGIGSIANFLWCSKLDK